MVTTVLTPLVGAVFGIALAAPPGPMNAIIAEESVLRGWTAGFKAGLGAMLADLVFFVGTLAGVVAIIDQYPIVRPALYLVGGVLMVYFAVGAFRDARSATGFVEDAGEPSRGFRKAFALSLTNPYQIGFWLTVGVGLLRPGTLDVFAHVPGIGSMLAGALVVQTGSVGLLVGFFVGIVCWIVSYPAALVSIGRRVDAFAPTVSLLSGVVLVAFGAIFLAAGAGAIV
ncbi:LysE family translocator [Halostagnicola kamekurae]|uniref:Threonine/homoserine/homoserine lactone efflux protein n=1 Tax=Halostagnicola kamekurae TaxID=619731 RepID=A0A1I6RZZ6_9EURY|nr:LysE family transporter [Halostagnicola kamekurae]SFS70271.1 Threonine/homoserine/homoserine lactone efflux protein [Halostagnicola kamekurae]